MPPRINHLKLPNGERYRLRRFRGSDRELSKAIYAHDRFADYSWESDSDRNRSMIERFANESSADVWTDIMAPSSDVYVAYDKTGQPAGFFSFSHDKNLQECPPSRTFLGPGVAVFHGLYANPDVRGIGLGHAMAKAGVKIAHKSGFQQLHFTGMTGPGEHSFNKLLRDPEVAKLIETSDTTQDEGDAGSYGIFKFKRAHRAKR